MVNIELPEPPRHQSAIRCLVDWSGCMGEGLKVFSTEFSSHESTRTKLQYAFRSLLATTHASGQSTNQSLLLLDLFQQAWSGCMGEGLKVFSAEFSSHESTLALAIYFLKTLSNALYISREKGQAGLKPGKETFSFDFVFLLFQNYFQSFSKEFEFILNFSQNHSSQ